jgi:Phosphotransferase enzyme family
MFHLTGPFDSEEEFNIALREAYVNSYEKEALISDRLDGMLAVHKHKIVFTHADLHFSNIMIHDGHISAIIDWADAAWYPDYGEYVSAMLVRNQRDGWNTLSDNAIGRPHCEYLAVERLRLILWP